MCSECFIGIASYARFAAAVVWLTHRIMSDFEEFEKQLSENKQGNDISPLFMSCRVLMGWVCAEFTMCQSVSCLSVFNLSVCSNINIHEQWVTTYHSIANIVYNHIRYTFHKKGICLPRPVMQMYNNTTNNVLYLKKYILISKIIMILNDAVTTCHNLMEYTKLHQHDSITIFWTKCKIWKNQTFNIFCCTYSFKDLNEFS